VADNVKLILVLALLGVGLFLYFYKGKPLSIKIICSAIVFTYALSGALGASDDIAFRLLMSGGLFFCMIGDTAIYYSFKSGAVGFAVAHLFFIVAFFVVGLYLPTLTLRIFLLIIMIIMIAGTITKFDIKNKLGFYVYFYTTIVSFMTTLALCAPIKYGLTEWSVTLAIGAICFLVSDILLAFIASGMLSKRINYISLPTYFLAISLLAHSVNI